MFYFYAIVTTTEYVLWRHKNKRFQSQVQSVHCSINRNVYASLSYITSKHPSTLTRQHEHVKRWYIYSRNTDDIEWQRYSEEPKQVLSTHLLFAKYFQLFHPIYQFRKFSSSVFILSRQNSGDT